MAPKKKHKKQPNLRSRIVNLIVEKGPRLQKGITKILGASYQSLNTEILELRRLGVLQKNDNGVLSLVQGVDLAQLGIEVPVSGESLGRVETGVSEPPMRSWRDGSLPLQEKFLKLLHSVGVKKADYAIAVQFFCGHIGSLRWLYKVLMVNAKGFVTEDQAKVIMSSWALFWGVPFDYDEFFGK